jgi:ureidoacrylate peracid hydrolase
MALRDACAIRDAVEGRLPPFRPCPSSSALLVVDVQFLDAHPDHGLGLRAKDAHGRGPLAYYFDRLASTVLPNIAAVLRACRALGAEVIYVRIAGLTPDGRENNWRYRQMGLTPPLDSTEARILDEIAPLPRDPVLTKSSSGAFASTNLERMLTRFGVEHLLVCGVVTHGCVETTVREAADRGYKVLLIEDACADYAPELHETALAILDGNFAHVVHAAEALRLLHEPAGPSAP